MESIIAQLKADIEEDEKEGNHSDREPDDIDKGKAPVAPKIAEGDPKIIFYHRLIL
jgi:hypothetical protein